MLELDLSGKNVVVTGGSQGIGEHLARQATDAGARSVLLTYNSGNDTSTAVALATGADRHQLVLGSQTSTDTFLRALSDRGPVDYFFANAGFSGSLKRHDDWDEINAIVNGNLTGNLYLLQGLVSRNIMAPGSRITVVGSAASQGNKDQHDYSAAKAGQQGAIRSWWQDHQVAEQRLEISLIEPAFVRTPATERLLKIMERGIQRKDPALVEEFREKGYVMDADVAAREILRQAKDPTYANSITTIPNGFDLLTVRAKYLEPTK